MIDGFWNWYRTYNTGAAFSFLSDAGGWQQLRSSSCWRSRSAACWLSGCARTPRGDWRSALPYRAGHRRRAGQRDRPAAHRPRGRLHPVALARPLLAGVQRRRFGASSSARSASPCSACSQPGKRRREGMQRSQSRHGRPARQSPRFLRRRRPRDRDRQARDRDARRADLRAPRGRAQPLRGRGPASIAARSSSRNSTRCPTARTVIFSAHGVSQAVREEAAASRPEGVRRDLPAGDQGPHRGRAPLPRRPRRGADRPRGPSRSRRHDGPVEAPRPGRAASTWSRTSTTSPRCEIDAAARTSPTPPRPRCRWTTPAA